MNAALLAVGAFITRIVGTMWCALIFLIIAIAATPHVFPELVTNTAQWFAQDVLQLVLLSIIMVGQDIQNRKAEALSEEQSAKAAALSQETHDAVMEELADLRQILERLGESDDK